MLHCTGWPPLQRMIQPPNVSAAETENTQVQRCFWESECVCGYVRFSRHKAGCCWASKPPPSKKWSPPTDWPICKFYTSSPAGGTSVRSSNKADGKKASCRMACLPVQSFSRVRLFVKPWTVAHQAPLSMESSKHEYWSGLPCPPPGNLPNPEIESEYLMSPALAGGFFTTRATWEACI